MAIRRIQQSVSSCLTSSSSVFSPVSVVKELLDNAIDAKCTQIQIEVDSDTGGLKHVLVRDNGAGVVQRDRALMCCNCTTSKISDIRDVETVETLGFRGEALFFVSQMCETMEITTRTKADALGERWIVKAGVPSGFKPVAAPVGTSVALAGLFKATPVRRNLLKKDHRRTIDKLKLCITNYSLAFPKTRFVLKFVKVSTAGKITASQEQGLVLLARDKKNLLKQVYKLKYSSEKFFNGEVAFGDIRVVYILPRMRAQDEALKKPFRALSLNQRPLSPGLSLGKAFGKVLNTVYASNSLLSPNVWVLEIYCPVEFVDVNIEPEKNDVLVSRLEEMLVEFGERIEGKVKLENSIESLADVKELEEAAEEPRETPVEVLGDEYGGDDESVRDDESEGEVVANAFKETDDAPAEEIPEPGEEPEEFHKEPFTQEQIPAQDDWTFTMLDMDIHNPEANCSVVETTPQRKTQPTTPGITTVAPRMLAVAHGQTQLHTPNAPEVQLKSVLNGRPVDLPRVAPQKNFKLEDMLEPYGEAASGVEVANYRYASESEVQWMYRKGRPSMNLLEGYLMLSRLTSANPLTTTDEITIDNRKKWLKLS